MKTGKFICGAVALTLLFNVSVGTSVDVFAADANDTVTNDNTQVLLKKSDINAAEKYKKYKVYWTVYWSLNSKAGAWHGK